MRSEKLTGGFRSYLKQLGYSGPTVQRLPKQASEFLHYTGKALHPEDITVQDIEGFMAYLDTRPLQTRPGVMNEGSKNSYSYMLRKFFGWLALSGHIKDNPLDHYEFTRYKSGPREPLRQGEIRGLFAATETYLEKSILHLFYSCGLRRNEGMGLLVSDIDLDKKLLYVRQGKGNKRRVVPITGAVKRDFYIYLEEEREPANDQHFLLGTTGNPILYNRLRFILKNLAEKAGIEKPFSLHHLRHSIATHLLEGGMKLEQVKSFLGHSSLESTQIYTHIKAVRMKDLKAITTTQNH